MTPPKRPLTPETSFGFEVIDYAKNVLNAPFDPFQEVALIHGGELEPSGRPRYDIVFVIAARQNGKTHIPKVLTVWWQFQKRIPLVVMTHTKLEYAKKNWWETVELVDRTRALDGEHAPDDRWYRLGTGEISSKTNHGAKVLVAASNAKGGRGLTVHRAHVDEIQEQKDFEAWNAITNAGNAVPDFQVWVTANAGDLESVVFNMLRERALEHIADPENVPDNRICLLEWSCEEDDDPLNLEHLAKANPNLGRRIDGERLLAKARIAVQTGGKALAEFKADNMCISVKTLDPAVDPAAWGGCYDPGTLDGLRNRAAVIEISPSLRHATLAVAAMLPDGRCRVEVAASWDGVKAVDQMRRDLPGWISRIKPRAVGWLPDGPAAAFGADVKTLRLPVGVKAQALTAEVTQVCMGFATLVEGGQIAHSEEHEDDLLNNHVLGAQRAPRGNSGAWVFSRAGAPCDAAYAAAGAVHLARTLPKVRASDTFVSV